ncbi:hypothetical protein CEUSTIGMA_g8315.t1 [Chlamydomonas eustigma]|uniref:Peptidase A1 domain-containing protein n=1 Tax=Chlamydomonas eustigma TaxID=1157962 RepID=A0A250XDP5_9CHLO|nr:hypothetical protein CEUSTIGMA_g8315.t1 [Chlamydomonas eustigma]|eukprot:GAX80880.1 hypothetical protein CEUSTIGMA_g8315.t1 [Chlamydomonas eustigma]
MFSILNLGAIMLTTILLQLKDNSADAHPEALTHFGGGLVAGGLYHLKKETPLSSRKRLYHRLKSRHLTTSISETTAALGLGQYAAQLILNGDTVHAVVDTGSGVSQLACTGSQIQGASSSLVIYDPATATPPFTLVPQDSTTCTTLCPHTNGCYSNPVVAGACEYLYQYGGGNDLEGRAYTANLTFPSTISNLSFPNYLFGCSFKTSTNPYMYTNYNALFGMDWESTSMWNQMTAISKGTISDTLHLCLGDGGDKANTTAASQSGVIVFGNSNSVTVTGASAGGKVVNVTMYDSHNLLDSNGKPLLFPPSMWVSLNSFSLVSSTGEVTALSMSSSNYYLMDTGTSEILLVQDAFDSLNKAFCPAVTALTNSTYNILCKFFKSNGLFEVEVQGAADIFTKTQLNDLFPTLSFNLANSTSPVSLRPSAYMILAQYDIQKSASSSRYLLYIIAINTIGAGTNQGILGNAFMTDLLIQQTQSTLQLSLTEVLTCDDVSYASNSSRQHAAPSGNKKQYPAPSSAVSRPGVRSSPIPPVIVEPPSQNNNGTSRISTTSPPMPKKSKKKHPPHAAKKVNNKKKGSSKKPRSKSKHTKQ